MGDAGDEHELVLVIDRVDDPVVTDADSKVVSTGELDCPRRAWIGCKSVDGSADAIAERTL